MDSSNTLVVQPDSAGLVPPPHRAPRPDLSSVEESTLREYLSVLHRRRWLLLGCIGAVLFITLLASLRATRMYEARSRIALLKDTPVDLGLKGTESASGDEWDYTVALDTQSGILRSEQLALQVIRELQLQRTPHFAKHAGNDAPDFSPEAAVLPEFLEGLKVTPVIHTRLLEIRYISPDPRLSAEIVNALVRDYTEQNFRTRFETTMQTSDWLTTQLGDLRAKVESSQQRLVEYQRKNNVVGLDEKQNIVFARLDQLNKELTDAQAARIEKEARYRNALSSNPELSVEQKEHGIPEPLRMRYAELKQQFAKLTTDFGPAYPRVIELKNELDQAKADIEAERAHIASRLSLEYDTALKREHMLAAAVEAQKQEANRLSQSAIEYNILKRDADTNRQLYEGLLQKVKEASVVAGLRSTNVRVVDPARVPTRPVSPNIPRNMALGLLLGTFTGILAAFLAEHLDNTIRTAEEAQLTSGLVALALVPLQSSVRPAVSSLRRVLASRSGGPNRELISQCQPQTPLAESYRSLRTSILLSPASARPRVLLVTSPLPQEGKTTTAINTALALAESGARVLLVDADLRRPVIHSRLGVASGLGLSTLLSGQCEAAEAITESAVPGLFLLTAGPHPPRPAELLGSPELSIHLAGWRREYDYVVLDSCPLLPVTDAVLLSVAVDSVMLVLRSGTTTRNDLRRARDLLSAVNARVLGLVVNAADLHGPDYRSYAKHYRYYAANDESIV